MMDRHLSTKVGKTDNTFRNDFWCCCQNHVFLTILVKYNLFQYTFILFACQGYILRNKASFGPQTQPSLQV